MLEISIWESIDKSNCHNFNENINNNNPTCSFIFLYFHFYNNNNNGIDIRDGSSSHHHRLLLDFVKQHLQPLSFCLSWTDFDPEDNKSALRILWNENNNNNNNNNNNDNKKLIPVLSRNWIPGSLLSIQKVLDPVPCCKEKSKTSDGYFCHHNPLLIPRMDIQASLFGRVLPMKLEARQETLKSSRLRPIIMNKSMRLQNNP